VSDARFSLEDRRLLNPAFCGVLSASTAAGHQREVGRALPFIYAYLVLPLVLHPETRERLPTSVATKLVTWTERNSDLVAQIPRRVADLASASRAGLLFAGVGGAITFGQAATISSTDSGSAALQYGRAASSTPEIRDAQHRAVFLGRWFSGSGTQATVLAALGILL
jgi:hypothetical protein